MAAPPTFSAFLEGRCIAAGELLVVLRALKKRFDRDPGEPVLLFDDVTGSQVDFDLRGSPDEVLERAALRLAPKPKPGRPKLGVVSREVSLLPRHWEWLEAQPNGISAALRRLVDEARKKNPREERARLAREAAHRFMTAVAGNLPSYEEASRALFANDEWRLRALVEPWPKDVRKHLWRLLSASPSIESENA
ncbi:MAG: hypothetical protein JWP97_2121 [Labilithrix sp.]|nr:hypothetical protein [Labilithrix sp.]